jgi:acyl-CoA synthetase (AMP-forming)/AMP-acid ligase II
LTRIFFSNNLLKIYICLIQRTESFEWNWIKSSIEYLQIDCPTGRRHTANQVYNHVLNVAAAFIELGLKKGEVVCFVCSNSDFYGIGLLGVIAAGGVFTACSDQCPYRKFNNL